VQGELTFDSPFQGSGVGAERGWLAEWVLLLEPSRLAGCVVWQASDLAGDRVLQGYLAHEGSPPRQDPTVALCLGTYGDPRGVDVFDEQRTSVARRATRGWARQCQGSGWFQGSGCWARFTGYEPGGARIASWAGARVGACHNTLQVHVFHDYKAFARLYSPLHQQPEVNFLPCFSPPLVSFER
jgi:hypothetical protein